MPGSQVFRFLPCSLAVAAALLCQAVAAAPLDPNSYPSGAPNPFTVAGTYVIDTSGTPPVMSGPVTIVGSVTPDNVVVFSFDSVVIGAGVTIRATGSRPLAILSRSTLTMSGGVINVAGSFVNGAYVPGAGGAAGGSRDQPAGYGPGGGAAGRNRSGGGGGGFGGTGGAGGGSSAGAGGIVYGNLAAALVGGSGGGDGDAGSDAVYAGGPAGGAIELGAVQSISLGGTVHADGYTGAASGGGGSGGGIFVHAPTVTVSGVLSASGGAGADGSFSAGGGGGGAGRIHVLTASGTMTVVDGALLRLAGGAGGTGAAGYSNGLTGAPSSVLVGTLGTPVGPPKTSGCLKVTGAPLIGASVKLKQKGYHAQTTTDSQGCYAFMEGESNRTGTITVELPVIP